MALVSFPTIGRSSLSLSYTYQAIITSHNPSHRNYNYKAYALSYYNNHPPFSYQPFALTYTSFSPRQTGSLLVPFSAKNSEPGEEDSRALETVLRLYNAIKNKNVPELSDIIGDECQCACNFFSNFQTFKGKKQVLDFFSYLIRRLGNSIEFVVTPTMHDGMNVGIKWRLQCSKTHAPLGKGFSFYMCHVYHGKVVIRNVEMFLEPLLHIEPFRLKIIGYVMIVMNKMSSNRMFRDNKRSIMLTLFVMVALLFLFNFSL
ncbi:uncharacterized protein LOC112090538 [Morus notabilis]|uniref:uncharacterized protein LOC112090538 n=1 Tax=Morus notabilis TaxID=981085 RepID=UPI000CED41DA|nr:uncharacterized protein LOC112090538 [Morus notabilis]